jgi:hypothetical protein
MPVLLSTVFKTILFCMLHPFVQKEKERRRKKKVHLVYLRLKLIFSTMQQFDQ